VIGRTTGWDEEYWLDIRPAQWHRFAPIMWARFDLARSIGCDGVEPDQNNPIGNNPGPPITLADEKAWYLEVARQAHARGLSVGMKNGVEVTDADTVAAFDWNLNEECFYYEECDIVDQFIRAGKAVFSTEYIAGDWEQRGYTDPIELANSPEFCPSARQRKFATLIKYEVPDASFVAC
jgi:Glycoside-hydrolase family GH114